MVYKYAPDFLENGQERLDLGGAPVWFVQNVCNTVLVITS